MYQNFNFFNAAPVRDVREPAPRAAKYEARGTVRSRGAVKSHAFLGLSGSDSTIVPIYGAKKFVQLYEFGKFHKKTSNRSSPKQKYQRLAPREIRYESSSKKSDRKTSTIVLSELECARGAVGSPQQVPWPAPGDQVCVPNLMPCEPTGPRLKYMDNGLVAANVILDKIFAGLQRAPNADRAPKANNFNRPEANEGHLNCWP